MLLAGAESFVFNQNYYLFFLDVSILSIGGLRSVFLILFAFGALVFFVRSMLVSSFRWRCFYFGVFALALSIEYGFHGALGRFTQPGDLENAFYASDASDKFGAMTLFFSWRIAAPLVAFRLLFAVAETGAKRGAGLFVLNLLILFAGFGFAADFYRPAAPMSAFAAHFNNLSVSTLYFAGQKHARTRREGVAPVADVAPANNIVFIVDESVRADHLSVNGYARDTTPTLRRLRDENELKSWGTAAAGATESVTSNRLLLTGLSELPDRGDRLKTMPTIFQYARAAGYRTFYFDGQGYSDWIGSVTDREDFGQIHTPADFPKTAPYDLDCAFAAKINEITRNSKGNFIWVNKRGVHFRYEKNYPAERARWTPTDAATDEAGAENDRPLENNYDNAVLYNSESFFGTLAEGDLPPATIFVYTSDHGQTLRRNRATHAGDSKPEALVPLLMFGADARLATADAEFKAAHRNVFATLLDLMNYPKELRVHDYAPSLFAAPNAAATAPRTFFVGNPSGAFGGRKILFDEIVPQN